MTLLLWNIVLAATWTALTTFTPANLALGFALGFAVLWLSPTTARDTSYFRKMVQVVRFSAFFLKELAVATLRISFDILTPTQHMSPAVIGIPLDLETDSEIAFLAIVLNLTPGTIALDVSSDRKTLYIHAMYAPRPDELRHAIKRGFERRVIELLR